MHTPRHDFYLATVRHSGQLKMFAIGGQNQPNEGPWRRSTECGYNRHDRHCGVEEWVDKEARWTERLPRLADQRLIWDCGCPQKSHLPLE